MNKIDILVNSVIDNSYAVSSDQGDLIFKKIIEVLQSNTKVELDFSGITMMTTAFLNASIGQLYSIYNSEQLNTSLIIKNIASEDKILFNIVIVRAKEYFADKKNKHSF